VAPPTHSLAVVSLVAGILGVTVVWGLGSLVAVITGTMALREIGARPAEMGGAGTARAGVILGWIGLALLAVVICAFCVFFLLLVPALGWLSRSTEPTTLWLGLTLAA
jgi:Domain of unknown function (DUF4190)